ncbi:PhzF family phenazine biosynthesis protein [Patulibacter defluvii]|uniref:PhzF family phenazine biosynthesis protein n=1 Tax=Patulibacter defluvii TaxID=3095358 RepID=UPI002A75C5B7|nr:PhzF family phenazine biosynthesis protein [Patulibacter sp. DM4]
MPELHVLRVFCDEAGRHGNPLGVVLDGGAVAAAERQGVAAALGFSETVFVDDRASGALRIFTPSTELPLAGHPLVGSSWLLAHVGTPVSVLRPPAGEVPTGADADGAWIEARPEDGPRFTLVEHATPEDVDGLPVPRGTHVHMDAWAWEDEAAGRVRARVFVDEIGVPEDEATGSAALRLVEALGRPLTIRQGRGSIIEGEPAANGRVRVAGRVVLDERVELASRL